MKVVNTKGFLKKLSIIFMLLILIMASYLSIKQSNVSNTIFGGNSELLRAMTYDQFEDGDEKVEGTDNVEFSAFFLRDVDGNGYAEKIKGTCKEIGKTDTLYLELNVLTEGKLSNGKIEINGQNFNFVTALPKDEELKDNYISNNTEVIELNEFGAGKQKLLTGMVQSGDYSINSQKISALGNTINNYSRDDNKIILTGTYVDGSGNETEIRKEITLNMDWYGITKTKIEKIKQTSDLPDKIDEENGTLNLSFELQIHENQNELILSKNYVEGTIPELNGYKPLSVTTSSNEIDFSYNDTTGKFIIINQAEIDDNGIVTKNAYTNTTSDGKAKYNQYTINVTYPLASYLAMDADTVTINIPIMTYYEGYNNPNSEFTNPYKSNEEREIIIANYENPKGSVAKFDIKVGKYINNPNNRYIISKEKPLKLYNGLSEFEENDQYVVYWYGYTGTDGATNGLVMKETANGAEQVVDQFIKTDTNKLSMENVTTNVGIGFEDVEKLINDDGWIKVYDEETENLLVTFTANGENGTKKWSEYTKSSPYYYEVSVKHIRVETSETMALGSIKVYNIKELDDEYITQNYTPEEFESLSHIQSQIVGYIGGIYVNTAVNQAKYEEPYSVAKIELSQKTISTQETEENEIITITADSDINANRLGWRDGCFLVKLPDEILDVEINNILINNSKVEIVSSEVLQNESGRFIKISTANRDGNAQNYKITIDTNLTANPRISTVEKIIELYASNVETKYYYYNSADIYDVNDNLNTEELVNKTTTSINLISPNSILTNQTMQLEDEQVSSEIVISPKVLELRPLYDNDEQEKQEVKIGIQLKNNYSHTISEIQILGKIPFEGNKYVISQKDLKSEFSTTMKSSGIEIPNDLIEYATIYYSENENPSRDIDNSSNGWKRAEDVTDWTKIKSYTIDLGEKLIDRGVEYTFYYTVIIPNGIDLNKTAYSHHGIYFCLDTNEGKYRTQTEPKKVGVSIADKFNLELTKYQKDREKTISGATYKISKLDEDGNVEETCTATTKANGKLEIGNLYAEKIYKIEEIKSPADYKLNNDIIKFIGHVDEDGVLTIEKLAGTTKGNITVTRQTGENYKANIFVEDEVNVKLKIIKTDKDTNEPINSVRYKITGEGVRAGGKILTTDTNGEASLNGLIIGEEYTIEETKTEGYYLSNPIVFKVINNNGTYEKTVTDDESVKETIITEDESIPTINIKLTDEKIPTYDLEITKIKQRTNVEASNDPANPGTGNEEITYLQGAKFKLYKDGKELGSYISNENGKILIQGLYAYESERDIDQTYVLKEVLTPDGYSKVKDIQFKVSKILGVLIYEEELEDGQSSKDYTIEDNLVKLVVEDSPSFKLIKKDAETNEVLANVKFALYNVDVREKPATNSKGEIIGNKEIINGREYYTVTTDANGELLVDLPEGIYKALEVEADEKYDLKRAVYYFGVGASRETNYLRTVVEVATITNKDNETVKSVINTADGGYLVTGEFSSASMSVANQELTNNGSETIDSFLIKYNDQNEVEWINSIGGEADDYITSVIETQDGDFIVGGYFTSSSIDIINPPLINQGGQDAFTIKFNERGEVEWAKSFGGTRNETIASVCEANEGYLVCGTFASSSITVSENTINISHTNNTTDAILIKYSTDGDVDWIKKTNSGGSEKSDDLKRLHDGGYIYAGEYNTNGMTFDGNTFGLNGYWDSFLVKYNDEDEVQWVKQIGGVGSDSFQFVEETTDGGLIISLKFNNYGNNPGLIINDTNLRDNNLIKLNNIGEIEFAVKESVGFISATSDGGFIVISSDYYTLIKYNSNHEEEWRRASSVKMNSVQETSDGVYYIGYDGGVLKSYMKECPDTAVRDAQSFNSSGRYNGASEVLATPDGGYLISGYFRGTITFGDYTFSGNSENATGVIAKYNYLGEVEWAKKFFYNGSVSSICLLENGDILATGYTSVNSINLDGYSYANNGASDVFIVRYDIQGNLKWFTSFGGSSWDYTYDIKGTSDGGFIVGGEFESNSIVVGDYTLVNKGRTYDGFFIKYDSNNQVEFAKAFEAGIRYYTGYSLSSPTSITNVCTLSNGDYVICGETGDGIIVGNYELKNTFIIRYDKNNNVTWATSFYGGGTTTEQVNDICPTQDGGFAIVGSFSNDSINIEGHILNKIWSEQPFYVVFDGNNKVKTIERIGEAGYICGKACSITETKEGAFLIGGTFYNDFTVGDYVLQDKGHCNIFILVIKDNEIQWATSLGCTSIAYLESVCEYESGTYMAAGSFYETLEAGKYTLNTTRCAKCIFNYCKSGLWCTRSPGISC